MAKILIIKDDTDINNLLSRFMREQGYEAVQAFPGTEVRLWLTFTFPTLSGKGEEVSQTPSQS